MSGLTSSQQWRLDHIDRCPTCGAWELITERELTFRQLGIHAVPTICHHIETAYTSQENAA